METRLVCGLIDAGKTSYINESIMSDPFYKYGKTLILCFERGETGYDEEALSEKKTNVAYYEGGGDITAFCADNIDKYRPDRIYVEMNQMIPGLGEAFPPGMDIGFTVTLIDTATLGLYITNLRQYINDMVRISDTVIFRGCSDKEELSPFSGLFRLMNPRAGYLREDPMGYHERAFDLFLPYSLENGSVEIRPDDYLAFCLDAGEHPEHYEGKLISFGLPLEIRTDKEGDITRCGRTVMTCCMADIQFMGAVLSPKNENGVYQGWVSLSARGKTVSSGFNEKYLELEPVEMKPVAAPAQLIISAL